MAKWIEFILFVLKEKKEKTEVYSVVAKQDGCILGEIKWFGRWRQYAFFPNNETVFEKTCLVDISNFISDLMLKRKEKEEK